MKDKYRFDKNSSFREFREVFLGKVDVRGQATNPPEDNEKGVDGVGETLKNEKEIEIKALLHNSKNFSTNIYDVFQLVYFDSEEERLKSQSLQKELSEINSSFLSMNLKSIAPGIPIEYAGKFSDEIVFALSEIMDANDSSSFNVKETVNKKIEAKSLLPAIIEKYKNIEQKIRSFDEAFSGIISETGGSVDIDSEPLLKSYLDKVSDSNPAESFRDVSVLLDTFKAMDNVNRLYFSRNDEFTKSVLKQVFEFSAKGNTEMSKNLLNHYFEITNVYKKPFIEDERIKDLVASGKMTTNEYLKIWQDTAQSVNIENLQTLEFEGQFNLMLEASIDKKISPEYVSFRTSLLKEYSDGRAEILAETAEKAQKLQTYNEKLNEAKEKAAAIKDVSESGIDNNASIRFYDFEIAKWERSIALVSTNLLRNNKNLIFGQLKYDAVLGFVGADKALKGFNLEDANSVKYNIYQSKNSEEFKDACDKNKIPLTPFFLELSSAEISVKQAKLDSDFADVLSRGGEYGGITVSPQEAYKARDQYSEYYKGNESFTPLIKARQQKEISELDSIRENMFVSIDLEDADFKAIMRKSRFAELSREEQIYVYSKLTTLKGFISEFEKVNTRFSSTLLYYSKLSSDFDKKDVFINPNSLEIKALASGEKMTDAGFVSMIEYSNQVSREAVDVMMISDLVDIYVNGQEGEKIEAENFEEFETSQMLKNRNSADLMLKFDNQISVFELEIQNGKDATSDVELRGKGADLIMELGQKISDNTSLISNLKYSEYLADTGKSIDATDQIEALTKENELYFQKIEKIKQLFGGTLNVDILRPEEKKLYVSEYQVRMVEKDLNLKGTTDKLVEGAFTGFTEQYSKLGNWSSKMEAYYNLRKNDERGIKTHMMLGGLPNDFYDEGVSAHQGLIDFSEGKRVDFENEKERLVLLRDKMTGFDPMYEQMPELLKARKAMIDAKIKNLDLLLNSPDSPFSKETISKLKDARDTIEFKSGEYDSELTKQILTTAVIIGVAVGVTLVTSGAAGWAIRGGLQAAGIGAETVAGSAITFAGTTAASAFGSTMGSIIGMYGTDLIGLSNFGETGAIDAAWGNFGNDFLRNAVYQGGCLGAVKVLGKMATVSRLASSSSRLVRGVGSFSNQFGKYGLKAVDVFRPIASPGEVLSASSKVGVNVLREATKKGLVGSAFRLIKNQAFHFGVEFVEEGMEEIIPSAVSLGLEKAGASPEAVGFVRSCTEFFLASVNSSGGVNVDLAVAGIDAKNFGLKVSASGDFMFEGSAGDFQAKLENEFKLKNEDYSLAMDPASGEFSFYVPGLSEPIIFKQAKNFNAGEAEILDTKKPIETIEPSVVLAPELVLESEEKSEEAPLTTEEMISSTSESEEKSEEVPLTSEEMISSTAESEEKSEEVPLTSEEMLPDTSTVYKVSDLPKHMRDAIHLNSDMVSGDMARAKEVVRIVVNTEKNGGPFAVEVLSALKVAYGNDLEKMKLFSEEVIRLSKKGEIFVMPMILAPKLFVGNIEYVKQISDFIENNPNGRDFVLLKKFSEISHLANNDFEKFKKLFSVLAEIKNTKTDREFDLFISIANLKSFDFGDVINYGKILKSSKGSTEFLEAIKLSDLRMSAGYLYEINPGAENFLTIDGETYRVLTVDSSLFVISGSNEVLAERVVSVSEDTLFADIPSAGNALRLGGYDVFNKGAFNSESQNSINESAYKASIKREGDTVSVNIGMIVSGESYDIDSEKQKDSDAETSANSEESKVKSVDQAFLLSKDQEKYIVLGSEKELYRVIFDGETVKFQNLDQVIVGTNANYSSKERVFIKNGNYFRLQYDYNEDSNKRKIFFEARQDSNSEISLVTSEKSKNFEDPISSEFVERNDNMDSRFATERKYWGDFLSENNTSLSEEEQMGNFRDFSMNEGEFLYVSLGDAEEDGVMFIKSENGKKMIYKYVNNDQILSAVLEDGQQIKLSQIPDYYSLPYGSDLILANNGNNLSLRYDTSFRDVAYQEEIQKIKNDIAKAKAEAEATDKDKEKANKEANTEAKKTKSKEQKEEDKAKKNLFKEKEKILAQRKEKMIRVFSDYTDIKTTRNLLNQHEISFLINGLLTNTDVRLPWSPVEENSFETPIVGEKIIKLDDNAPLHISLFDNKFSQKNYTIVNFGKEYRIYMDGNPNPLVLNRNINGRKIEEGVVLYFLDYGLLEVFVDEKFNGQVRVSNDFKKLSEYKAELDKGNKTKVTDSSSVSLNSFGKFESNRDEKVVGTMVGSSSVSAKSQVGVENSGNMDETNQGVLSEADLRLSREASSEINTANTVVSGLEQTQNLASEASVTNNGNAKNAQADSTKVYSSADKTSPGNLQFAQIVESMKSESGVIENEESPENQSIRAAASSAMRYERNAFEEENAQVSDILNYGFSDIRVNSDFAQVADLVPFDKDFPIEVVPGNSVYTIENGEKILQVIPSKEKSHLIIQSNDGVNQMIGPGEVFVYQKTILVHYKKDGSVHFTNMSGGDLSFGEYIPKFEASKIEGERRKDLGINYDEMLKNATPIIGINGEILGFDYAKKDALKMQSAQNVSPERQKFLAFLSAKERVRRVERNEVLEDKEEIAKLRSSSVVQEFALQKNGNFEVAEQEMKVGETAYLNLNNGLVSISFGRMSQIVITRASNSRLLYIEGVDGKKLQIARGERLIVGSDLLNASPGTKIFETGSRNQGVSGQHFEIYFDENGQASLTVLSRNGLVLEKTTPKSPQAQYINFADLQDQIRSSAQVGPGKRESIFPTGEVKSVEYGLSKDQKIEETKPESSADTQKTRNPFPTGEVKSVEHNLSKDQKIYDESSPVISVEHTLREDTKISENDEIITSREGFVEQEKLEAKSRIIDKVSEVNANTLREVLYGRKSVSDLIQSFDLNLSKEEENFATSYFELYLKQFELTQKVLIDPDVQARLKEAIVKYSLSNSSISKAGNDVNFRGLTENVSFISGTSGNLGHVFMVVSDSDFDKYFSGGNPSNNGFNLDIGFEGIAPGNISVLRRSHYESLSDKGKGDLLRHESLHGLEKLFVGAKSRRIKADLKAESEYISAIEEYLDGNVPVSKFVSYLDSVYEAQLFEIQSEIISFLSEGRSNEEIFEVLINNYDLQLREARGRIEDIQDPLLRRELHDKYDQLLTKYVGDLKIYIDLGSRISKIAKSPSPLYVSTIFEWESVARYYEYRYSPDQAVKDSARKEYLEEIQNELIEEEILLRKEQEAKFSSENSKETSGKIQESFEGDLTLDNPKVKNAYYKAKYAEEMQKYRSSINQINSLLNSENVSFEDVAPYFEQMEAVLKEISNPKFEFLLKKLNVSILKVSQTYNEYKEDIRAKINEKSMLAADPLNQLLLREGLSMDDVQILEASDVTEITDFYYDTTELSELYEAIEKVILAKTDGLDSNTLPRLRVISDVLSRGRIDMDGLKMVERQLKYLFKRDTDFNALDLVLQKIREMRRDPDKMPSLEQLKEHFSKRPNPYDNAGEREVSPPQVDREIERKEYEERFVELMATSSLESKNELLIGTSNLVESGIYEFSDEYYCAVALPDDRKIMAIRSPLTRYDLSGFVSEMKELSVLENSGLDQKTLEAAISYFESFPLQRSFADTAKIVFDLKMKVAKKQFDFKTTAYLLSQLDTLVKNTPSDFMVVSERFNKPLKYGESMMVLQSDLSGTPSTYAVRFVSQKGGKMAVQIVQNYDELEVYTIRVADEKSVLTDEKKVGFSGERSSNPYLQALSVDGVYHRDLMEPKNSEYSVGTVNADLEELAMSSLEASEPALNGDATPSTLDLKVKESDISENSTNNISVGSGISENTSVGEQVLPVQNSTLDVPLESEVYRDTSVVESPENLKTREMPLVTQNELRAESFADVSEVNESLESMWPSVALTPEDLYFAQIQEPQNLALETGFSSDLQFGKTYSFKLGTQGLSMDVSRDFDRVGVDFGKSSAMSIGLEDGKCLVLFVSKGKLRNSTLEPGKRALIEIDNPGIENFSGKIYMSFDADGTVKFNLMGVDAEESSAKSRPKVELKDLKALPSSTFDDVSIDEGQLAKQMDQLSESSGRFFDKKARLSVLQYSETASEELKASYRKFLKRIKSPEPFSFTGMKFSEVVNMVAATPERFGFELAEVPEIKSYATMLAEFEAKVDAHLDSQSQRVSVYKERIIDLFSSYIDSGKADLVNRERKDSVSAVRKILGKLNGRIGAIRDNNAMMFVVSSYSDLQEIAEKLKTLPGKMPGVVSSSISFDVPKLANVNPEDYSFKQFKISLKLETGDLVEIQVQMREVFEYYNNGISLDKNDLLTIVSLSEEEIAMIDPSSAISGSSEVLIKGHRLYEVLRATSDNALKDKLTKLNNILSANAQNEFVLRNNLPPGVNVLNLPFSPENGPKDGDLSLDEVKSEVSVDSVVEDEASPENAPLSSNASRGEVGRGKAEVLASRGVAVNEPALGLYESSVEAVVKTLVDKELSEGQQSLVELSSTEVENRIVGLTSVLEFYNMSKEGTTKIISSLIKIISTYSVKAWNSFMNSSLVVELSKLSKNKIKKYNPKDFKNVHNNEVEKMKEIEEMVQKYGEGVMVELLKAKDLYGDDIVKMKEIADLISKVGYYGEYGVIVLLEEAKSLYENDFDKFKIFAEIAINQKDGSASSTLQSLVKAKNLYKNDLQKFDVFVELAKTQSRYGLSELINANSVYENDPEKFEMFVEIFKLRGSEAVRILVYLKNIYDNDMDKFRVFASLAKDAYGESTMLVLASIQSLYQNDLPRMKELAKIIRELGYSGGRDSLMELLEAKSEYENEIEKFKVFVGVVKNQGGSAVRALIGAKSIYGNDKDKFDVFAELANSQGEDAVKLLMDAESVYRNDIEKLRVFAVLAKEKGESAVRALMKAESVYGDDKDKFDVFAVIAKEKGESAVRALMAAESVYGSEKDKFDVFAELANSQGEDAVKALVIVQSVYGNDIKRMKELSKTIYEVSKEYGGETAIAVASAKNIYAEKNEKLKEVVGIITELKKENLDYSIMAVRDLKDLYGDSVEKLKEVTEIIKKVEKKQGRDTVIALVDAQSVYGEDFEKFKLFAELAEIRGAESVIALVDAKSAYENNFEIFKTFLELAEEYGEDGVKKLYDAKKEYIDYFENFSNTLRSVRAVLHDSSSTKIEPRSSIYEGVSDKERGFLLDEVKSEIDSNNIVEDEASPENAPLSSNASRGESVDEYIKSEDLSVQEEANSRPGRLEMLSLQVESLFPGEALASLREDIKQRSFNTPQFGEYHNEGVFMDKHIEIILRTINDIAEGKFHELVPEDLRAKMQKIVSQNLETFQMYAFLHDVAKPDCLTLKYGDGKKEEISWKEWEARLPEDAKTNPIAMKAFLQSNNIAGISYFHNETEKKNHGKAGVEKLLEYGTNLAVPSVLLTTIANHEVAFQFQNIAVKTYYKYFGELSDEEKIWAITASYTDTLSSLSEGGSPDLSNFRFMVDSAHNAEIISKVEQELKSVVGLNPNKINNEIVSLTNRKTRIEESADELIVKLKNICKESRYNKFKLEKSLASLVTLAQIDEVAKTEILALVDDNNGEIKDKSAMQEIRKKLGRANKLVQEALNDSEINE